MKKIHEKPHKENHYQPTDTQRDEMVRKGVSWFAYQQARLRKMSHEEAVEHLTPRSHGGRRWDSVGRESVHEMTSCAGVPAVTSGEPITIGFKADPRKKKKRRPLPPATSLIDSICGHGARRVVDSHAAEHRE